MALVHRLSRCGRGREQTRFLHPQLAGEAMGFGEVIERDRPVLEGSTHTFARCAPHNLGNIGPPDAELLRKSALRWARLRPEARLPDEALEAEQEVWSRTTPPSCGNMERRGRPHLVKTGNDLLSQVGRYRYPASERAASPEIKGSVSAA